MWKARVGAWALVTLCDGSTHRGVVYTVDPEAGHLVLLVDAADATAQNNTVVPLVLPASSVASVVQDDGSVDQELPADATLIRVADEDADSISTRADKDELLDAATIERRRTALCELLRSQRAPFEERPGGELLILGCLHVAPPYTPRACRCENAVVLDRFLTMLEGASAVVEGAWGGGIAHANGDGAG